LREAPRDQRRRRKAAERYGPDKRCKPSMIEHWHPPSAIDEDILFASKIRHPTVAE
jgi:hypothetical protein